MHFHMPFGRVPGLPFAQRSDLSDVRPLSKKESEHTDEQPRLLIGGSEFLEGEVGRTDGDLGGGDLGRDGGRMRARRR